MPSSKGFELAEALDLLALCSIVEGSTELPQPPGWTMLFDSPVIPPFTEKWQLWQNTTSAYAIVVRGTVYDPGSILEDLLAFLALAAGSVTIGPYRIDYKFAADPHASVNVGFTLGALLVLKDPVNGILAQLADKVPAGSQIYVTGHSQGAAETTSPAACPTPAAAPAVVCRIFSPTPTCESVKAWPLSMLRPMSSTTRGFCANVP
jgi:hypothetical protein